MRKSTADMKRTISELVDVSLDVSRRQIGPARPESTNDSYQKYVKVLEEKRQLTDVLDTFSKR